MSDTMDGRPEPIEGEVLERQAERATSLPDVVTDESIIGGMTRAEIDVQIATARKFRRSLTVAKKQIETWASLDIETADSCTYGLPRREKDKATGKWVTKILEGPSIRFAEIVLAAWGNARVASRRTDITRTDVEATSIMHDLETNVAIAKSVRRGITTSAGARYSLDMINVTTNAASAIAMRNAVLAVVPKAFWGPAWEMAKKTARGESKTLPDRRKRMLEVAKELGVDEGQVLELLGAKGLDDIGIDALYTINTLLTSIRDGDTTIEELLARSAEEAQGERTLSSAFKPTTARETPRKEPAKAAPAKEAAKPDGVQSDSPAGAKGSPSGAKAPAAAEVVHAAHTGDKELVIDQKTGEVIELADRRQGNGQPEKASEEQPQGSPEAAKPDEEEVIDVEAFNKFDAAVKTCKTWDELIGTMTSFVEGPAWVQAGPDMRRQARSLAYMQVADLSPPVPSHTDDPKMFWLWMVTAQPHRINPTWSMLVRSDKFQALSEEEKDQLAEAVEEMGS